MSICVLVKVGEGLIFATDSASSIIGQPVLPNGQPGPQGVLKVFYTGKKIFQIKDLPIGVMSWGAGAFKDRTVASLIEEFENTDEVRKIEKDNINIEEVAAKLWNFMKQASESFFSNIPIKARPKTGLVLGGYSEKKFFPEEYVMNVPITEKYRPRPDINGNPNFGANWYGITDAIVRFHHGRDDRIFQIMKENGIEEETIKKIDSLIQRDIQYPVLFNAMPLDDAIQYAKFLVELTIARFKFSVGAEVCGGKINIVTITRKEGFRIII